jgi:hypothetical protein
MKSVTVDTSTATPDDEDAYGEKQKVKKTKKIKCTGTVAAFMQAYIALTTLFFEHRDTAHWQAKQFDNCIDNLMPNHAVILIDYNMNYSHNHPMETQGEHWRTTKRR